MCRRIAMPKIRTHFDQVPLEVVKKIVEGETKREEATESGRGAKKKEAEKLEQLLAAGCRTSGKDGKT